MSHLLINSTLLTSYRNHVVIFILLYCIKLYSLVQWLVSVGFVVSMNALVIAKVPQELNDLLATLR